MGYSCCPIELVPNGPGTNLDPLWPANQETAGIQDDLMLGRVPEKDAAPTGTLLRRVFAEKSINSARIGLVGPDGRN